MGEGKWQRVRQIFDSALKLEPDARRDFVKESCGDDKSLFDEVESLLSSHENADSFLEKPAAAELANVIEAPTRKLEPGKFVGHYEIIKLIGSGGMGEVYLAKDQKLDRRVAVKILNDRFSQSESNLSRFIQEAKAASGLNHPNILVIHEIGETEDGHYIVSEFIDGKTLRHALRESSLQVSEILRITIQIVNALAAAHSAHLVHRDIKPENIMIRPDGFVKILDFGLAKLIDNNALVDSEAETKKNLTAIGMILGTVNYMSPEQAKGEQVDERTDIFSLGAMVYELIAGRPPFQSGSMSETFAKLIYKEPLLLSQFASNVPPELQRIVSKMLRKSRDDRYQTMKDLFLDLSELKETLAFDQKLERLTPDVKSAPFPNLADAADDVNLSTRSAQHGLLQSIKSQKLVVGAALAALALVIFGFSYYLLSKWKTDSKGAGKRSIAVLPTKPINTTNRDEIFEIGIADSLIYKLSSIRGLVVRPLSAIRKYADIEQDPIAAGKEQEVDYVLSSNYQLAGGKIRITAQLFNVSSGQIEETYKSEKDVGDVFAMQDAIAGEVSNILLARFVTTAESSTSKRGTTNEEAYRLYLQARYLVDKRNLADAQKAIAILEQAISLDPNYARAWALKAYAHNTKTLQYRSVSNHEEYQKSVEAIYKALALEQNLSEAHGALCENKMYYEWDFAGAERECKRAVELDPNSSLTHQSYARYLMGRGRYDEVLVEARYAIDLDPTSLFNQRVYGVGFYYARRYDEAVMQFKRTVEMDLNNATIYPWLIAALEMQGNQPAAFEWFIKFRELGKTDDKTIQLMKSAYQTSGWQGALREQARLFDESNQAYFFGACIYAQLRDKEKAFENLEKAYQRREWTMVYIQAEPRLDPLRNDPRYDDLVKRVGLK